MTYRHYPVDCYLLASLDNTGKGYMALYSVWRMSQTCINSITFNPYHRSISQILYSKQLYQNLQRLVDTKINTEQAMKVLDKRKLLGFNSFVGMDTDMILSLAYAGTGIEEIRGTGMALYLSILDHAERIRFTKKRSLADRVKITIPGLERPRSDLATLIINSGS